MGKRTVITKVSEEALVSDLREFLAEIERRSTEERPRSKRVIVIEKKYRGAFREYADYARPRIDEYCRAIENASSEQACVMVAGN